MRLDWDNLRQLALVKAKVEIAEAAAPVEVVSSMSKADGDSVLEGACKLELEGIVSKRLTTPYKSGPCRSWIKVRNPKSPAYLRIIDGTF